VEFEKHFVQIIGYLLLEVRIPSGHCLECFKTHAVSYVLMIFKTIFNPGLLWIFGYLVISVLSSYHFDFTAEYHSASL